MCETVDVGNTGSAQGRPIAHSSQKLISSPSDKNMSPFQWKRQTSKSSAASGEEKNPFSRVSGERKGYLVSFSDNDGISPVSTYFDDLESPTLLEDDTPFDSSLSECE